MQTDEFLGYVGDPDFHDGAVVWVGRESDTVVVDVDGLSGQKFIVEFRGVTELRSHHVDGMMLYGLAEMKSQRGERRFVFVNWDDEDDAFLEIEAAEISIRKVELQ